MAGVGLGAAAGLGLAIAIPYSGIFAKVFAELIEAAGLAVSRVLSPGVSAISRVASGRLPKLTGPIRNYQLYGLECGLRSTFVLGFIGLPTMGFYVDGSFSALRIDDRPTRLSSGPVASTVSASRPQTRA